jgi:acyl-coenzyme A synthetase/AMP-(fatty) acid ligase
LDVFWNLTSTQWELRSRMLNHLFLYKVPRRIWFADALPRTRTGEVQRSVLAHRWGKEPG